MYHTREATLREDKVFALLGMSSDDPIAAGLAPNYGAPWKETFKKLVKFILYEDVPVETWNNSGMAVVRAKGRVLGEISKTIARHDRQLLYVSLMELPRAPGDVEQWTLPMSAKPIQAGDIVCLLEGVSKPTIIRPNKDHFTVIMITFTPLDDVKVENAHAKSPELIQSIAATPHDFLLVWDCFQSLMKFQSRDECEPLLDSQGADPSNKRLENDSQEIRKLEDVALVLEDLKRYDEAAERRRKIMEGCEKVCGGQHQDTLSSMEKLGLIYMKLKQWKKAKVLFKQVIQTKKQMQGLGSLETLKSMGTLAALYRESGRNEKAVNLEVMIGILQRKGGTRMTKFEVIFY